jgi:uncharacterized protein DUF3631
LTDIQPIMRTTIASVIPTKDLIATLTAADDRPWATWRHDKPITPRALARLLGPLGIHPCSDRSLRGYRADAFSDAIARYLPSEVSKRHNPNETGPESPISMCHAPEGGETLKMHVSPINTGLRDALTHRTTILSRTQDNGDAGAHHPDLDWRDPEERE